MLLMIKVHMQMMLELMKRLLSNIKFTGVPYFIINQKYAISGAQPLETFVGALQQVWEEENPAPKLQELSSRRWM